MIHFIYRTHSGENKKGRPPWYSKDRCLASFFEALCVMHEPPASVLLICDSPELPAGCDALVKLYDQLSPRVEHSPMIGLPGTHMRAVAILQERSGADHFYLSEDDYLYRSSAFSQLEEAVADLPGADYLTLYDHPDRYRRNDDRLTVSRRPIVVTASAHWRLVESTCMTFGGRIEALSADAEVHRHHVDKLPNTNDRRLWRALQSPRRLRARRRLYGVVPSQASHQEVGMLAPNVDWEAVAITAETAARKRASNPSPITGLSDISGGERDHLPVTTRDRSIWTAPRPQPG
jgi:hypothetical protein